MVTEGIFLITEVKGSAKRYVKKVENEKPFNEYLEITGGKTVAYSNTGKYGLSFKRGTRETINIGRLEKAVQGIINESGHREARRFELSYKGIITQLDTEKELQIFELDIYT